MAIVKTEQLLKHLLAMTAGAQSGDTLEGSIEFTAVDAESWDVNGAYRVGNLLGQGGMVLLNPTETKEPASLDMAAELAWKTANDPARQEPIRRLYEDAALDLVAAIKRDYLPTMDDNDGGQILSWALELVCVAVITEVDRVRGTLGQPPAADAVARIDG